MRTLISFFRFLLKQQYRILRCPGFSPSTTLGMERSRSARLNRISSCGSTEALKVALLTLAVWDDCGREEEGVD
jgi:hypothetical protein